MPTISPSFAQWSRHPATRNRRQRINTTRYAFGSFNFYLLYASFSRHRHLPLLTSTSFSIPIPAKFSPSTLAATSRLCHQIPLQEWPIEGNLSVSSAQEFDRCVLRCVCVVPFVTDVFPSSGMLHCFDFVSYR